MWFLCGIIDPDIHITCEPLKALQVNSETSNEYISDTIILKRFPKFDYFLVKNVHSDYLFKKGL
jgi:hypothetical protein